MPGLDCRLYSSTPLLVAYSHILVESFFIDTVVVCTFVYPVELFTNTFNFGMFMES